ncbi:uncharacterized protein LTR77_005304 [Saxophila tyrrhenica]|uniref:FAD binding domain-containing protein n=1 Tax=Saxophila tyrrhenica TaxID=1690608 RepID=A0AAV9PBK1_9PEZI|nr:hypothetical protein LTR77_005304 [Saxophila tyrrhenica]
MARQVDLVIVGAGPAGLMAAAWAAFYNLKTVVLDKRPSKIEKGHADGLQSRTLEILHSFGFGDQIYREANRLQEVCFWVLHLLRATPRLLITDDFQNPDNNGVIRRTDRIPDTILGISRFQQSVLHQGRIEDYFLEFIDRTSKNVHIQRSTEPFGMHIDETLVEAADDWPITVRTRSTQDGLTNGVPSNKDDLIQCKYLIGCDGAHSWVRGQMGLVMEGEQTESVWGVMDVIPVTNFPDIRMRCVIHSASSGSIMVIPRERGLVRLYIQLASIQPGAGHRYDRAKGSPEMIFEAAQRIMRPWEIRYDYCEWWTIYQIGQRLGNGYGAHDRIFLAGDAVHTHSPKAGQGMNVSIQDTYNLGWKIGSVLTGTARRSILSTYESERRPIAKQLIDFDRKFSRMFSGRPAKDIADEAGISMTEFKSTFEKGNIFTSGTSVEYAESQVVSSSSGKILRPGVRFPSFQVVCQCDATPVQLADALKSDGIWRLVVFCGDLTQDATNQRLKTLGKGLEDAISALNKPVVEPILVHASSRDNVELADVPAPFYYRSNSNERDYYRVFADDWSYHHGHGHAYGGYDVDRNQGLAVLVRPDQYIAWAGDIDDTGAMEEFLDGCLL